MTTRVSSAVLTLSALVVAAAAFVDVSGPLASGQQAAAETKSEYMVASIDANTLQAKVTELAGQGWEVVAVNVLESRVDGAATPPKVITEKYDVTLRRTIKR